MAIRVIAFMFLLIILFMIITQVLIPALQGTPLFPWFRKSTNKLAGELAEIKQQEYEFDLKQEIEQRRKSLSQRQDQLYTEVYGQPASSSEVAQSSEVVSEVPTVSPTQEVN